MSDTPETPENEDENPVSRSVYDGPAVTIEHELKTSYLDYAMSVIVSRAIPDLRDGLKPVHRRILYAMHETNNSHDKPYRKSSRPVAETMGKYHPHGDSAIYDALVAGDPDKARDTMRNHVTKARRRMFEGAT